MGRKESTALIWGAPKARRTPRGAAGGPGGENPGKEFPKGESPTQEALGGQNPAQEAQEARVQSRTSKRSESGPEGSRS